MNRTMHKRTAHRWRLTAIMMAATFFALGSFWLVQMINRSDVRVQADGLKTEPDYIVERFSFVRMTPEGQPRYVISGDKLTHRPIDDTAEVDKPVILNLSVDLPPTTIHAKRAHIDQANNVVELQGDVDVARAQSAKAAGMNLKTEALTVFTAEERMETKQPFELLVGSTRVTGVGMRANNATGQFDVLSRAQLGFPPQGR